MSDIYSKIKNKTQDKSEEARKNLVKIVKYESGEFSKSVAHQTGAIETTPSDTANPIVEAMQQRTKTDTPEPGSAENEKRVLHYLEKELEELRQKEKQEEEQKKALELQQKEEEKKPMLILQEPPSKPKKGLFGVKKKQGTKEMGKQITN